MYWIAKPLYLPLQFFCITKNITCFQKTRTKLAASGRHWRLRSSPIVEKNMWFSYVNWLVGWGTKKKSETNLTKKKTESERIDVLCEKVFSIEEIKRKKSKTRERIAVGVRPSDAGRLAWCKANVLRRHRGDALY